MQMDVRRSRASVTIIVLVTTVISIIMTPMAIAVETDTQLVYLYSDDTTNAKGYISLLADSGYQADLVPVENLTDTDLSKYNVLIIGPDTTWEDTSAVDLIKWSNKPLIGLGEGGYELFGQLGLGSGYPNGWHGSENSIYVVDPSNAIFQKPNIIEVPEDGILQLYESSRHVGIYIQSTSTGMTTLGKETGNEEHYPLLLEENKYIFWGFTASPESMTDIGKALFSNIVAYMNGVETSSEELKRIETPSIADLPVFVRPELMRIETIKEPIVFATPMETVEKGVGDTFDLGDGYILVISEVNASGEVQVQLQQNGELIEEKTLMEDQSYFFPKATEDQIAFVIDKIEVNPNLTSTNKMLCSIGTAPYMLLTVVSQPSGAEIFIDGKMKDFTPKEDLIIMNFNEHTLRLELDGYQSYEETIKFTQEGEKKMEKYIHLNSSSVEKQASIQPETTEEINETEVTGSENLEEEKKLPAEKEQEEKEPTAVPEGETEKVPGFLLVTTCISLIFGYSIMRRKKE